MTSRRDYPREKIGDADLQAFAESEGDERLSVLIEADVEPPRIIVGERPWAPGVKRPVEVIAGNDAAVAERMTRLHEALRATIGEAQRLDVAHAFVAEVTPARLREIARLREVAHIRPNRRRRAS